MLLFDLYTSLVFLTFLICFQISISLFFFYIHLCINKQICFCLSKLTSYDNNAMTSNSDFFSHFKSFLTLSAARFLDLVTHGKKFVQITRNYTATSGRELSRGRTTVHFYIMFSLTVGSQERGQVYVDSGGGAAAGYGGGFGVAAVGGNSLSAPVARRPLGLASPTGRCGSGFSC